VKRPLQQRRRTNSFTAPAPALSTTLSAPPKAALVEAACRTDFASFARKCFHQLNPGSRFLPNWHIEAIAYHLELVRRGTIKRLIINIPPRSLKSLMGSVSFPAFVLGHDPSKRIIVVSYGEDLAVKLANDFRAIVDSDWYRRLFPWMQVSRVKNTELEVLTTLHGYRLATSIDGTLTGRGGDIIIIDDPLKPGDAQSESRRERVNNWYANTLVSRLDDKVAGAIVVVMQRLHVDDLTGMLLRSGEEWTVLNLPAIAEVEQKVPIGLGIFHTRQVDDLLHSEREPKSALAAIRSQLGSDTFAAQYQQSPMPSGGAMIKRDWVRRHDRPPSLEPPCRVIQSWDTANKEGAQNDWSVCTTWAWLHHRFYLVDVLRGRYDYPSLKARAIEHARLHRPERILIEEAGVGVALIAELSGAGLPVIAVKPERDKVTRMSVQSAKFECGSVWLPERAPWLADLEAELFAFPNSRHDDQVDSISQALAHEFSGYGWTDEALQGLQRLTFALSLPCY
jgi:predicted phage terminase large subunit-like protein